MTSPSQEETGSFETEGYYAKQPDGFVYYYWRLVGSDIWNKQKTALKDVPYIELAPAPVPNEPSDSPTHAKHMQSGGELHVTEPSAIGDELTRLLAPLLEDGITAGQIRAVRSKVNSLIEQQTKLALEWALEVDTDDLIQRIRQLEASIKERSEG